jgi:hypothetical protein
MNSGPARGSSSPPLLVAYADLLDDVGAGRLTPEEAQTERAEPFALIELAAEIEALRFANSQGRRRSAPSVADPPVRPH